MESDKLFEVVELFSQKGVKNDVLIEMLHHYKNGKTIYVQPYKDKKRKDSIAKITAINNTCSSRYYDIDKIASMWSTTNQKYLASQSILWSYYDLSFTLGWDGRKNYCTLYLRDFVWLKDYPGPTEWSYVKVKKEDVPKPIIKDVLGREVNVGDCVCYPGYRLKSRPELKFGNIIRINPKTVNVKSFKIDEDDMLSLKRLLYGDQILLVTKDMSETVMYKKLLSDQD